LKKDGSIDETNLLVSRGSLAENVATWDKDGFRIKMHVTGEGAVRVALDAFEQARKQNGKIQQIHELGHANKISLPDQVRLNQLNVAADMSPGWGGLSNPDNPQTADAWKFRTLLEAGALLTAGSDFPLFPQNPFPFLQNIITHEKEAISLRDALTIITRNGARVIGREDELGSIEEGKVANMIVLDQHLFEIYSSAIGKTRVLKTVFRGKTVYEAAP
jgi:hypothetical protein